MSEINSSKTTQNIENSNFENNFNELNDDSLNESTIQHVSRVKDDFVSDLLSSASSGVTHSPQVKERAAQFSNELDQLLKSSDSLLKAHAADEASLLDAEQQRRAVLRAEREAQLEARERELLATVEEEEKQWAEQQRLLDEELQRQRDAEREAYRTLKASRANVIDDAEREARRKLALMAAFVVISLLMFLYHRS